MKLHRLFFNLFLVLLPSQLALHFWPNWSFVYGLRVDYLSPAVFLTDILITLVLFSSLFDKNVKSQYAKAANRYKLLIVLFTLFLLANLVTSVSPAVSAYKWVSIVKLIGVAAYVACSKVKVSTLSAPLLAASAYTAFLSFLQMGNGKSIGGLWYLLGERWFTTMTPGIALTDLRGEILLRPYATFPHPNALAAFGLFMFFITINQKHSLGKIASLAISVVLIAISFSENAVIALFVGMLLYFSKIKIETKKALGALFVVLLIVASLLTPFLAQNFVNTPQSISERLVLSHLAGLTIARASVLGQGLGTFIKTLPDLYVSTQIPSQRLWLQPVHNMFLLVAAEAGLVGLLVFAVGLLKVVTKVKSHALFALLIVIAETGFLDHYWLTLQQTSLLFAITIGLILGDTGNINDANKN